MLFNPILSRFRYNSRWTSVQIAHKGNDASIVISPGGSEISSLGSGVTSMSVALELSSLCDAGWMCYSPGGKEISSLGSGVTSMSVALELSSLCDAGWT